jgi:transcription antitermination factor NusG
MWVVGKIKQFQLEKIKNNLKEKEKNGCKIDIYAPRFVFTRKVKNKFIKIENNLLDNYVFFNLNFNNFDIASKSLKFTKGLSYILNNFKSDQETIKKFIKNCKNFEDERGFIKPSFFSIIKNSRAKFLNGPFSNFVFEVIEKKEKEMNILLGSLKVRVPYERFYLKNI